MKKLISLLVCFAITASLCVPAFAANTSESSNINWVSAEVSEDTLTPPPELIIGEGEEWIPDAVDPRLISMHSDEDECGHYTGPSNYRFIGAVRGSTEGDILAVNVFLGVISLFVSGIGKPLTIANIAHDIYDFFAGDKLYGNYIKYQYVYNFGPDPNMYWFHTFYEFAMLNGEPVGNACYATYSPPKPGDRYQD